MGCIVPGSQMAAICTQPAMTKEEKQHFPYKAEFPQPKAPQSCCEVQPVILRKGNSPSSPFWCFPPVQEELPVQCSWPIHIRPLPCLQGKEEGRRKKGEEFRAMGWSRSPKHPSETFPSIFFLILYYGLRTRKNFKDSLRTHKRSCIIETNSGMTRTNIFSNLVCNTFYA